MVNEEVSKESIQFAIRISQFTAQEVMMLRPSQPDM